MQGQALLGANGAQPGAKGLRVIRWHGRNPRPKWMTVQMVTDSDGKARARQGQADRPKSGQLRRQTATKGAAQVDGSPGRTWAAPVVASSRARATRVRRECDASATRVRGELGPARDRCDLLVGWCRSTSFKAR